MRGHHPNSQANLKKFKEGESGNPSGRPKAFIGIKDELTELVNSSEWDDGETHRDIIVDRIVTMAEIGDKWAIELIERLGCLD